MSPEENAKALLARLDELHAQVNLVVTRLLDQAATLGAVRRELETARAALAQLIDHKGEPT